MQMPLILALVVTEGGEVHFNDITSKMDFSGSLKSQLFTSKADFTGGCIYEMAISKEYG